MTEIDRDIGRLIGAVEALIGRVERMDAKIDKHMDEEAIEFADHRAKLHRIEQHLSAARFVWMLIKAAGLTVVFIVTVKFGDIPGLWRGLLK